MDKDQTTKEDVSLFSGNVQSMMTQMGLDKDLLPLLWQGESKEDLMVHLSLLLNQISLMDPERVSRAQSHCLYAAGHTVLACLYPEHSSFHLKEAKYQYIKAQTLHQDTYYAYLVESEDPYGDNPAESIF